MNELIASSITPSLEDRVVTRGMVRKGTSTFKEIELVFLDEDLDSDNQTIDTDEYFYASNNEDTSEDTGEDSGEDSGDDYGNDSGDDTEKDSEDDPDYTGRSPGDPITKNKYLKTLTLKDREKIKSLEENIKKINNKSVPLRYKILGSHLEIETKASLIQSLDNFEEFNSEYYKYVNYIQNLLEIPFGTYNTLSNDIISNPTQFLLDIKNKLDDTVYGHSNVKNEILQMLSYQIVNNKTNSQILGLHGPPGIGKTTIIKDGLSNILQRPFFFISLGGISDASYLEGHSYTYEGSKHGMIVEILKTCKCMNPIIYFDELDKISKTAKGDEIVNLLIHLTDETQNDAFKDKYFDTVTINLSQVAFIFSFNDINKVNPILRDRINVITMNDFNKKEKIRICNKFFIPKFMKEYKIENDTLTFPDETLEYIYNNYNSSHTGLRGLKTTLKSLISKISMLILTNCNSDIKKMLKVNKYSIKFPLSMDTKLVDLFLSDKKTNSY